MGWQQLATFQSTDEYDGCWMLRSLNTRDYGFSPGAKCAAFGKTFWNGSFAYSVLIGFSVGWISWLLDTFWKLGDHKMAWKYGSGVGRENGGF
jgi:hypothetical protein